MSALNKLANQLGVAPPNGVNHLTIPSGAVKPRFEIIVTQVECLAEVLVLLPKPILVLSVLEECIYQSYLDRVKMALGASEVHYPNLEQAYVLRGDVSVHVYLRPTEHYGKRALEPKDVFDIPDEADDTVPALKICKLEYAYDINEETENIPYSANTLFRSSKIRHPQLNMIFMFGIYQKQSTKDIENAIDVIFNNTKNVKVYFVPSGIVITDVFDTILITLKDMTC
jgi:hypothetical protein